MQNILTDLRFPFCPPQAGWTDAPHASPQLRGSGSPCQRAAAAARHGPVRRGCHHQHTHAHPHCHRHQHLPWCLTAPEANVRMQTAVIVTPSSPPPGYEGVPQFFSSLLCHIESLLDKSISTGAQAKSSWTWSNNSGIFCRFERSLKKIRFQSNLRKPWEF